MPARPSDAGRAGAKASATRVAFGGQRSRPAGTTALRRAPSTSTASRSVAPRIDCATRTVPATPSPAVADRAISSGLQARPAPLRRHGARRNPAAARWRSRRNRRRSACAGARRSPRGVPTCTMRPSLKTATRSAIDSASPWSWVTKTKVMPSDFCSAFSSSCICSRSLRSSAPSGSSSSSTFGRLTSARASATRWRWPPESWPGRRVAVAGELAPAPAPPRPRLRRSALPTPLTISP